MFESFEDNLAHCSLMNPATECVLLEKMAFDPDYYSAFVILRTLRTMSSSSMPRTGYIELPIAVLKTIAYRKRDHWAHRIFWNSRLWSTARHPVE
jgi:hypothetical protein